MTQPNNQDGYIPRKYEADARPQLGAPPGGGADFPANQYADSEARRLQNEAVFGHGYRAGLNPPDLDYRSIPHEQLIGFVNDGVDPQAVDEQGQIANDIGNTQKDLSAQFRQAAAKEETAWQGPAAEAAHGFFGQLAQWADDSGESAFLAANRFSDQSTTLAESRSTMPPPAGRTVQQSMDQARQQLDRGDVMGYFDNVTSMQEQARLNQQAHEQAAAVLGNRDQRLYGAGSTQPSFAAPPQLQPDGHTQAASASAPPLSAPGAVHSGPGSSLGSPRGTTSSPGGAGTSPPSATGYPGRVPAAGPGPSAAPGGGVAGPWGSSGDPGDETTRSRPGSRGTGFGRGSAAGRISGYAGGKAETRRAPGTRGAPGEGAPGKGSGAAEPEARGARGAAGAAEAARGAAGGKGSGAAGAAGPAGRGKEEDKEHKRPEFLREADPHEYFGTDGLGKTTPPVIGEDSPGE
jgi:hypothetical protein